jgi:hypothetical protein
MLSLAWMGSLIELAELAWQQVSQQRMGLGAGWVHSKQIACSKCNKSAEERQSWTWFSVHYYGSKSAHSCAAHRLSGIHSRVEPAGEAL